MGPLGTLVPPQQSLELVLLANGLFFLSTDSPGARGPSWDKELVDAPSKGEHLDELSEEEEDVSLKVELVLVEATSAPDFDELGEE